MNYCWCWGRPCVCGELVSGFHHCKDGRVVRQYDFCHIPSSLIVYHINLGWSCNLLSATLISWHHPVFWRDIIKSKEQNTSPMRRAVGFGDLRKGIKKTFTFYLCHITSDESLPSLDCSVFCLTENFLSCSASWLPHRLWLLLDLLLLKPGACLGWVHSRSKLSSEGTCCSADRQTLQLQYRSKKHPGHLSVF